MNRPPPICGWMFILTLAGTRMASADPAFDIGTGTPQYNWLQPVEQQQTEAVNGTFSTTSGQNLNDPFAVVSSGTLWQDSKSVTYSRPIMDNLALNCSSSATTQDGSPDALGNDVRAETVFKPLDTVTVKGNVHDTSSDQSVTPVVNSGAGASVETRLPLDTVFTAAVDSDHTACDATPALDVTTNAYDAQVQKPLGKLPVSLVLKGHYVATATPGAGATRLPSFEQSLVWKPVAETTLQAGLRQQQYQNFPGIDNELNEALFADWSQKIIGDFSWHSYAEMVNSRSTVEIAASGAGVDGTPQPITANGGTSLGSALPVSTSDETVTFSTGPSIKLLQDVSASLQYSNSWDQNPVPGAASSEQRVSLSLKGTF
jgi:hypothetical protein